MADLGNLCMNCMADTGGRDVCPVCGRRKGEPQTRGGLPLGTSLQGRYLAGYAKRSDGEGIVYIGFDKVLNLPVELHEFFPNSVCSRSEDERSVRVLGGNEEVFRGQKEKFLGYARGLAHMRELSAIVQIYDIFEENGTAYTVSDWDNSISLRYFVERSGGSLGWNAARQLFMPVLSSLSALHMRSIGHYGISPDTLQIRQDGKMKLSGFSIDTVRRLDADFPPDLVPGCAAVEQYGAGYSLSEATDVYGFAASLFFALTGSLPPDALRRRTDARLLIPNAILRSLPPYVVTALANALQVSPERRTASFERLRAELSAAPAVTAAIEESQRFSRIRAAEPRRGGSPAKKGRREVPGFVWVLSSCVGMLVILAAVGAVWMNYAGFSGEEPDTQAAVASQASPEDSAGTLLASLPQADQIDVPSLLGQNYTDLMAGLSSRKGEQDYQVLLSTQQFSDTVPEGCILSQDPKPGGKMAKGTAIVVVVSEGAAVRTLPKIAGKTLPEASGAVTDAGFIPSKTEEPSDTVPVGRVIGYQDVKEGSQMAYGSHVVLVVSSGPSESASSAAPSSGGG